MGRHAFAPGAGTHFKDVTLKLINRSNDDLLGDQGKATKSLHFRHT
jgi:hypothetical protein